MNLPYMASLVLVIVLGSSALAGDAEQPVRTSFEGLEGASEGVVILGTLFKTHAGDYINFVPAEMSTARNRGVWSRSTTPEVKAEALQKVAAKHHLPVLATYDISVTAGRNPSPGPASTGVYRGPIHNANLKAARYLSQPEAREFAAKLIQDEAARKAFLARFETQ